MPGGIRVRTRPAPSAEAGRLRATYTRPAVVLVAAGVEYGVPGIGYEDISEADAPRSSPVSASGLQTARSRRLPRPERFGDIKADVLEHYAPGFVRGDFVRTILDPPWSG